MKELFWLVLAAALLCKTSDCVGNGTASLTRSLSADSRTPTVSPRTASGSASTSDSTTPSVTKSTSDGTASATASLSTAPSRSLTASKSETNTLSSSPPLTSSGSRSWTGGTSSQSTSHTTTTSRSLSSTVSPSETRTSSRTETRSIPSTRTSSPSRTPSMTPSTTPSNTLSVSRSVSHSTSTSASHSFSASVSHSSSASVSFSPSPTHGTPSRTSSLSKSFSLTASTSVSESSTASFSLSFSTTSTDSGTSSASATVSDTISGTFGTISQTLSLPLTTSAIPPTTSPPPTPTATFVPRCPEDCGHGRCTATVAPFICECDQNTAFGYWSGGNQYGGSCDRCLAGVYGPDCKSFCPGGFCAPCNLHGVCSDGLNGTGVCTCFADPIRGFWQGEACTECVIGYVGEVCELECFCSSHGRCVADEGAALCVCSAGWGGKNCTECRSGFFGPECARCPWNVATNQICSSNGLCVDGLAGTGECRCFDGYGGAQCEIVTGICSADCIVCPSVPGGSRCSNRGNCTLDGKCVCEFGFVGVACEAMCPRASDGSASICGGHGACYFDSVAAAASCDCDRGLDSGFWSGTSCTECASLYSGQACTKRCPTAMVSGAEQPCSGVGTCRDGLCFCSSSGRCGAACEQFVNCLSCQCSSHGLCEGGGRCICDLGWVGTACQLPCPVSSGAVCGGHGTCQDDGTCLCFATFGGPECAEQCGFAPNLRDGGKVQLCAGEGVCNSTTGRCVCNLPWVGLACDECVDGLSGAWCTVSCINGQTNGRECTCDDGYGGSGCSTACPDCGGHGSCSNATGACVCATNWFGPTCNCTHSMCGENRACDTTTGDCKCDAFHDGAACEKCSEEYWGHLCDEPCFCREIVNGTRGPMHGVCDRLLGTCTCFNDDDRGHFAGEYCRSCASNYFGTGCVRRSVASGQLPSLAVASSRGGSAFQARSKLLLVDDDARFLYVVGDVFVVFNTSTIRSSRLAFEAARWELFPCGEVATAWLQRAHLFVAVLPQGGCRASMQVVKVPRLTQSTVIDHQTTFAARQVITDFAMGTMIQLHSVYVEEWDMLVNAFVQSETLQVIVGGFTLDVPNATLEMATELGDFAEVRGLYYSRLFRGVVIYGSATALTTAACHGFVVFRNGQSQRLFNRDVTRMNDPMSNVSGFIHLPSQLCLGVDFSLESPHGVMFAVATASGPGFFVSRDRPLLRFTPIVVRTGMDRRFATMAAAVDVVASQAATIFAAQCIRSGAGGETGRASTTNGECHLVKLSASGASLELLGVQKIGGGELVSFAQVSSRFIVYILLARYPGAYVRRFLAWDVSDVFPPVADYSGGTRLTVSGTGFRSAAALQCFISRHRTPTVVGAEQRQSIVPATFVSPTEVTCEAPRVGSTSTCGEADFIQVSMIEETFTSSRVQVRRIADPVLLSSSPRRQFIASRPFAPITVVGPNFIDSPSIACRFSSHFADRHTPYAVNFSFVDTAGFLASPGEIVCAPPPVPLGGATPGHHAVAVAADGFYFSAAVAPYVIVGLVAGIEVEDPQTTIRCQERSPLPLRVFTVDAQRNHVLGFDDTPYPVALRPDEEAEQAYRDGLPADDAAGGNSSQWFTSARLKLFLAQCNRSAVEPQEAVSRTLRGQLGQAAAGGVAVFSQLYMSAPASGAPIFYRAFTATTGWEATLRIQVAVGEPSRLVLCRQPHLQHAGSSMELSALVHVVDVGWNIIDDPQGALLRPFHVISTTQELLPEDFVVRTQQVVPNPTRVARFDSGVADFRAIPLYARFGAAYVIQFSLANDTTGEIVLGVAAAHSRPVQGRCAGRTFPLTGTYQCLPCLQSATCDGESIVVSAGYWRSTDTSLRIYPCRVAAQCPGGAAPAACSAHATGPLCALCEEGHSRGIGTTCDRCLSNIANLFVLIVLVLLVTLTLSFIVIFTVQNSDRLNNLATVCQMFVTHWQTVALFAQLDNPWPQYFRVLVNTIDAFADVRVLDASFGQCLMSYVSMDHTHKFLLQLLLLLLIFVVFALTRAALFMFPDLMKRRGNVEKVIRPTLPMTQARILVASALITLFFLFQGLLLYAMELLVCFEVDFGDGGVQRLLTADPSVNCDETAYRRIRLVAIPVGVLLLFGIPVLGTIAFVAHSRLRPNHRNERMQYTSFLVNGLSYSAWWWPALVFARKGVLVSIVVLLGFPLDAQLSSWTLVLYLIVLSWIRPYRKLEHQRLEVVGTVCALVSLNLGTLYHTLSSSSAIVPWIAPLIIVVEAIVSALYVASMSTSVRDRLMVFFGMREVAAEVENVNEFLDADRDEILARFHAVERCGPSGDRNAYIQDEADSQLADGEPCSVSKGAAKAPGSLFVSQPVERESGAALVPLVAPRPEGARKRYLSSSAGRGSQASLGVLKETVVATSPHRASARRTTFSPRVDHPSAPIRGAVSPTTTHQLAGRLPAPRQDLGAFSGGAQGSPPRSSSPCASSSFFFGPHRRQRDDAAESAQPSFLEIDTTIPSLSALRHQKEELESRQELGSRKRGGHETCAFARDSAAIAAAAAKLGKSRGKTTSAPRQEAQPTGSELL